MSERTPTLGVHLLETITRGMYSEPLHCIREYVQNAYDSIRAARRAGVLAHDAGTVVISIDRMAKQLRIRDDGAGLSPEAAAVHLLDIGSSEKARSGTESRRNAGFRGIGRMAGISYCKTLRFRTSEGNGKACTVEFDAAAINRLTQPGQEPATIIQAITDNSRIDEERDESGAHYLEVTLEGVKADSHMLNEDRLAEYLGQVAPVRCDPTKWSFDEKLRSFAVDADSSNTVEAVSASICDADGHVLIDIRRPFMNTFRTKDGNRKERNVRVTDVTSLPHTGPIDGWWGWLAAHERRGQLADASFAGLRVRMHNIAIGDARIVSGLFKTRPLALWCFGEIHVTAPELVPNAQRDDFEPSVEWDRIKAQIRDETARIESDIRSESKRRSVERRVRTAKKKIEDAQRSVTDGFASHDEKEATIRGLQAEAERLEKQERKNSRTESDSDLSRIRAELEQTVRAVEEVRQTDSDAAQAHLGRQCRRVLRTVFEVLRSEVDEETFRRVQRQINAALQPGNKE